MASGKAMPYINATPAVCKDCTHYHSYADMCGYCADTGKLRAFENGKQRLPAGKCDKYEPKTTMRRRKTSDELFGTTV